MKQLDPARRSRHQSPAAYFRPRDMPSVGLSPAEFRQKLASGQIEKVGHGLYRETSSPASEFETLAMIAAAVPSAIICLLSALAFHGIGTQLPHEVWLALGRKAHKPRGLPAPVRIFRFSGAALHYGVKLETVLGVSVRVTSPARTVVDCFRYRNKLGLDVALEALRDSLRSRKATIDEITRAAEVCRARTVLKPYLEALSL